MSEHDPEEPSDDISIHELPKFVAVAHTIGDPQLGKLLLKLATHVKTEIHNAKFPSLRRDVRSDLKHLKAEAKNFEDALDHIWKYALNLPIGLGERSLPHIGFYGGVNYGFGYGGYGYEGGRWNLGVLR